MQQISKKTRLVILLIAMTYAVGSSALRVWLALSGNDFDYAAVPPEALSTMTAIIIPLTIFTLCVPWLVQFRRAPWLTKTRSGKVVPPALVMLACYSFLLSPIVFGSFLHACGMPITQVVYFYAVAIIVTLAWGIYDLRKV